MARSVFTRALPRAGNTRSAALHNIHPASSGSQTEGKIASGVSFQTNNNDGGTNMVWTVASDSIAPNCDQNVVDEKTTNSTPKDSKKPKA